MTIKGFEEFLKLGIVKTQTPNINRAISLIKEAEGKKRFLEVTLKNIPPQQIHYNSVAESCYDILMELIRAKMFIDGFNSKNSHEAEVSYMKILGFTEAEIRFMNEIRYNRNGIKYYGTVIGKEYAEMVLQFMHKIYPKLKQLVKEAIPS